MVVGSRLEHRAEVRRCQVELRTGPAEPRGRNGAASSPERRGARRAPDDPFSIRAVSRRGPRGRPRFGVRAGCGRRLPVFLRQRLPHQLQRFSGCSSGGRRFLLMSHRGNNSLALAIGRRISLRSH